MPRAVGCNQRGQGSGNYGRSGGGKRSPSVVSTVPSLVRLGRDEVVRPDALPFLVTRLINDRAAASRAAVAEARENDYSKNTANNTATDGKKGGGGWRKGVSAIQSRLTARRR